MGCAVKWFKHDTNANSDGKLQNVLLDYGLEGYGLYWYCIELIAGGVDVDNITFSLEHDARIIARNTGSTAQKVEEMMRYFCNIGLFENADGAITCMKLAKRLDQSMTSNKAMRAIIDKLKEGTKQQLPTPASHSHDEVMTTSCQSHDLVMKEEIRSEEIREEEKKPPKPKAGSQPLDFSSWPSMPSDQLLADWKALRKRHKADITQTVITGVGKQLREAAKNGFTVEQCFEEWICRGWRGFKAEWMSGSARPVVDRMQNKLPYGQHVARTLDAVSNMEWDYDV